MPTIDELVLAFLDQRNLDSRYASFDFCYGYFSSHKDEPSQLAENGLELSCLHLMAYLASWGMLRASSRIFQKKSMRHFAPTIELIASGEVNNLWKIDCDRYSEANIQEMVRGYDKICSKVVESGQSKLTLVTKIMMGVFGCCPALDTRVTTTLRAMYGSNADCPDPCGFRSFNVLALRKIKACYESHQATIDELSNEVSVLRFDGDRSNLKYTKAKILDMALFQANGQPLIQ